MSDKMMRIAARKPNATATPVSADTDGRIITNRTWKKVWETIETGVELRSTTAHECPAVDLRDVPLFSLRFINRLDVPVTLYFKTDVNTSNGYGLVNKNAEPLSITLQPTTPYIMVTFNDLPELQYMQYLRITVKAYETPTSGTFEAYIVKVM